MSVVPMASPSSASRAQKALDAYNDEASAVCRRAINEMLGTAQTLAEVASLNLVSPLARAAANRTALMLRSEAEVIAARLPHNEK